MTEEHSRRRQGYVKLPVSSAVNDVYEEVCGDEDSYVFVGSIHGVLGRSESHGNGQNDSSISRLGLQNPRWGTRLSISARTTRSKRQTLTSIRPSFKPGISVMSVFYWSFPKKSKTPPPYYRFSPPGMCCRARKVT